MINEQRKALTMKTRLLLLGASMIAMTACTKQVPAPSTQDVTSAPVGAGPRGWGAARGGAPGGGPRGPATGPHMACPSSDAPLSDSSRTAIERALADERAAEARYDGIVQAVGPTMPFQQLQRAERRHSLALEQLLVKHHATVPAATTPPIMAAPNKLRDACVVGVALEKNNIALYDELMTGDLPEDVRCVFSHLRDASRERHLPALERCAAAQ